MGYRLAERDGYGWNFGGSRPMPLADAISEFNRRSVEVEMLLVPVYPVDARPSDGTAHSCPYSDGSGYFIPFRTDLDRAGDIPVVVDRAGLWPIARVVLHEEAR